MHLSFALNAFLGSILIIILIFLDYLRKYNADSFQRTVFFTLLVFTLISIVMRFVYYLFEGRPGREIWHLLNISNALCYIFQVLAYYYFFVFIDYSVFKDSRRTKKIQYIVLSVTVIHVILLAANLKHGYYFLITDPANTLIHGEKHYIRLILSYSPLIFATLDIITSPESFKRYLFSLFILFLLLSGISSGIDIMLGTSIFLWPCLATTMLYAYFFIIRTEANIDSLTGISNRYSFNEFVNKLSRQSAKESYAIVMIDMDHFKKINDTLGHLEGDNALKDMAAIIKGCIRRSDFAARYGGDEFVLATRVENNIEKLMERIQQAITIQNEKKIRPYQIEMSYGCDVYTTGQNQSINEFLTHIDTLMYKQKGERRRSSDRKG